MSHPRSHRNMHALVVLTMLTGLALAAPTPVFGQADEPVDLNAVFLRPQWLMDVMKCVVRHDQSRRLDSKKLRKIRPRERRPAKKEFERDRDRLLSHGEASKDLLDLLWLWDKFVGGEARDLWRQVEFTPELGEELRGLLSQFGVGVALDEDTYLILTSFWRHDSAVRIHT